MSESCLLQLVLVDVFPISSSAASSRSSIFSLQSFSGRSAAREAALKMALLMFPPLISNLPKRSKSTELSRGVSSGIRTYHTIIKVYWFQFMASMVIQCIYSTVKRHFMHEFYFCKLCESSAGCINLYRTIFLLHYTL